MTDVKPTPLFDQNQTEIVNDSVAMAEELVSDHFKMSASQWLHPKYDVKTVVDLSANEIVFGPFAQVIRYKGRRKGDTLESSSYDYYKICLQDHEILSALENRKQLRLFPFSLYIVTHELIHIVRFSKFLQSFNASEDEKFLEETRVHDLTRKILEKLQIPGMRKVLNFYSEWRTPIEGMGHM